MAEKLIDIICFSHRGGVENRSGNKPLVPYKRYAVPPEKVKEKVCEIVERLINGEIDAFTVSLR